MKSNLIALTTATLFAAGGSMLTPVTVRAANNKSPDAVYFSTDNVSAKSDVDTKDLDAKLADARARLEQAAHDVAELSSDMGRPLMDKLIRNVARAKAPATAPAAVPASTVGEAKK